MGEKKYGLTVKIAVLTLAAMLYTTSMTTPALGEIARAFPNVSPTVVKQISTIPSLMMIIFSLVPGQLERFISKKAVIYLALILSFMGILPAFFGGMTLILVSRILFGAGHGMLFPYAASMIAYLFEGEERNALMGYKTSVGAVSGIVFQMLGGILAMYSWRYAFLGFLLIIPSCLMIMFMLPEPEKKSNTAEKLVSKGKVSINTYIIAVLNMLLNVLTFSFMTNVSIVMVSGKIGNAAQAGFVLTLFTVGSFIASMMYGRIISKIFRKFTIVLAVGLYGLSFLLLVSVNTYSMFCVAGIIYGLGFGTFNPEIVIKVIKSSSAPAAISTGILFALQGLGQFSSPFALTAITKILRISGIKAAWNVSAVCVLGAAIILCLVLAFRKSEKPPFTEAK